MLQTTELECGDPTRQMAARRKVRFDPLPGNGQDYAPGPTGPTPQDPHEDERNRAMGIYPKRKRNVNIELSRADWYRLIQFCEDRAVHSENYLEVRQAVLFSEMLRKQAREQE